MAKRLTLLLVALLVLGFTVAGCGDDESSGNGDTAAETATDSVTEDDTVTEDETVTDTDTVTEETDTSDSGGAAAPDDLSGARKQALEQCQKSIGATPNLQDDTKEKLEDLCETAASGDPEDIREAAGKVCEEVIDDIAPEGSPGREAALQSCRQQQR